jgi:uncharacterized protein YqjF (DUF2071 family)
MDQHVHQPLPSEYDRVAACQKPDGLPLMHQDWLDLVFLHWSVDAGELAKLLPADVEVDLFNGRAWIGIAPFRIENMSPGPGPHWDFVPPFHELNVRTYVYRGGVPGVWFFSLDAENQLAVWAARLGYRLPYFHAEIEAKIENAQVTYRHRRLEEPHADFECACRIGERIAPQQPGSFEFFLAERYVLYTEHEGKFYRARIHHEPWPLFHAEVDSIRTTLFEADTLPIALSGPVAHFSPGVHADIWSPEVIRKAPNYT